MDLKIKKREEIEDIETALTETLRIEIFHKPTVPLILKISRGLKEFNEQKSIKSLTELITKTGELQHSQ